MRPGQPEISEHRPSVTVGVAGLGYWGPNLARNFAAIPGCELRWLCDPDPDAVARAAAQHPRVSTATELDALLADPELDAVALATPVSTHAELAIAVLAAGKHCFVEKPLATTAADAERAVAAAQRADRVLMVGHLLEYHPGLRALAQLADSG
ncbi:MAG: Gfo/Idh/MocA family protein, partial [Solirubrobacteraceae bacterium]